jgi:hypothetical protein
MIHVVNFGKSKGGLSTVGYQLYNSSLVAINSRETSGISEIGTSTGIYGVNLTLGESFEGIVLWDTGEGSPRYGVEQYRSHLMGIKQETDKIRLIWNTLKNQADLYAKVLSEFRDIRKLFGSKNLIKIESSYGKIEKLLVDGLKNLSKYKITVDDIKNIQVKASDVNLPAPVVNIPKTIIPDYTKQLEVLNSSIRNLLGEINKVPKSQKDYGVEFISITTNLKNIISNLKLNKDTFLSHVEDKTKVLAKSTEVKADIVTLIQSLSNLSGEIKGVFKKLDDVDGNISNTMKPGKFIQDIHSMLKQSEELKGLIDKYKKMNNAYKAAGLG